MTEHDCKNCQKSGWSDGRFCQCETGEALQAFLANPIHSAYYRAYPIIAGAAGITREMLDESRRIRND